MITSDIQKLEPGNRIMLFEVDGSAFNADILRFHNEPIGYTPEQLEAAGGDKSKLPRQTIWWQGREYSPWPVQITGIEVSGDGRQGEPVLTVANLDNRISALCHFFDDMLQAKVIIHTTFVHYLDARNFPEGNPTADPTQEYTQIWYIGRKTVENKTAIEFALSSPIDLQGLRIPTRQIHNLCTWCIRGDYRSGRGCDYAGNFYFDEKGNPTDDPAKDKCGGLLHDCKLRFGQFTPLPFGGSPASSMIKGR